MGHTRESSWVPSVTLLVGVGNEGISALLLGADGRVRGDADMVFEGQPVHPSGAVRLTKQSLSLALHEVEPEVERIVIAGPAASGSLAAMAPDRQVVVAWLIARPDDAEAVVYGEFFRESGGWKFTGIGKGYASGLAELVTAYGVEVEAEVEKEVEQPAPAPADGPVPLTGVAKAPGQTPSRPLARSPWQALVAPSAPARAAEEVVGPPSPTPSPVPTAYPPVPTAYPPVERPYELVEGWEFGPVFEPFTASGKGGEVVTVDGRVPPGPVLVEAAHEGKNYFGVFPLNKFNKDDDYLFNTTLPHFTGSSVIRAPGDRSLRLRVDSRNRWALRVSPVASARRLTGTLRGYGPEALLFTGGAADLRVHFEGKEDGSGYVGMWCHEVAGRTTLLTHPDLIMNATGALAHTVPIPPGPLLLLFSADGAWTLTVREID
ncbi:TerD family protein [Streptomyces narbonensis]|uniref:TerD family protein n=1 Tax=Streptomyces narbonensis TaxID=67333 RepID=UPI0019B1DD53|nr:TerD family protein [Streptomyces narbonensis]GGV93684.1 resistance protein [Streptomyces narbonensis]